METARISKPAASLDHVCCEACRVLTGAFLSLQAGTWGNAQIYPGIYASWAVLLLLVLITLARALYWACMRVSQPLQNFT